MAGSLNRPTSHEAATNSGRRSALVSAPASVSRNTLSSAILNGLPCPMKLNAITPCPFRFDRMSALAPGLVSPGPSA